MSLDVSEAIALAKDLLRTSNEFHAHDPDLAAQFADRAVEICDDLGIDRALIGEPSADSIDQPASEETSDAVAAKPAEPTEEDTLQTSQHLRELLQQQARVLQNAREANRAPEAKSKKRRPFRLFGGRPAREDFGALQSA